MAWIQLPSVTVANGSKLVTVPGGYDLANVEAGWSFDVGSYRAEIQSVSAQDVNGVTTITLARNWDGSNVTAQPAQIVPIAGGELSVIKQLQEANDYAVQTHAAMRDYGTIDADITLTPVGGDPVTFASMPKQDRLASEQRASLAADYETKKSELTIISRDAFRDSVEKASGGRNTVIYDDQGNPNVMVVVPRFNYEDLGLTDLQLGTGTPTAFMTNGVPRSEILVSKYLNSTMGSGCASVGGADPRTSVNFDQAKALCTAKGAGWHLFSMHEWEAIKLWCIANGTIPLGNTNYGRSHVKLFQTAIRVDGAMPGDTAGTARTMAGGGLVEWAHDHTEYGIMDLVGNTWDWIDQFKLIDGRIHCTSDNDPDADESTWTARDAYLDGATGAPTLNSQITSQSDGAQHAYTNPLRNMAIDPSYVSSELMRRLGIEQLGDTTDGAIWHRNVGERLPIRGGAWGSGGDAGLGALGLYDPRTSARSNIGFRSALFV